MQSIGLSSTPLTVISASSTSPPSRSSSVFMESPEITGLLYKRRGGFGKMMPNAWQFRLFVLSKEGVLAYYDTDLSDCKDGTSLDKDRGHIDLKHINFELTLELVEGAPTSHVLTIIPDDGSEKWRLCAETKDDHMRWYKVFEKYCHLVKDNINTSHRSYNRQSIIPSVLLLSGFNQDETTNHNHGASSSIGSGNGNHNDHVVEASAVTHDR